MKLRPPAAILFLFALAQSPAYPGAYLRTLDCTSIVNGFCAQGRDREDLLVQAGAIVHPPGFSDMTQGVLRVEVCTDDPMLEAATQRAVATWSSLIPVLDSCNPRCKIPEEFHPTPATPEEAGAFHADSVVLHELGHALGLDHPNLRFEDPLLDDRFINSSFSAAYTNDPVVAQDGADEIRGSRDDLLGIAAFRGVNVTWFRENDNDPFIIDSATIDINNFSRDTSSKLPEGSTWASNANYCHGYQRGYPGTQALMYSNLPAYTEFLGLSADDVNMVEMQQTGLDRIANSPPATPDDYNLDLQYVESCTFADIEIKFVSLPFGTLGGTDAVITKSFPQGPIALHYTSVFPNVADPSIDIVLNSNTNWFYGPPHTLVFYSGFETGDTGEWNEVVAESGSVPDVRGGDPHPYSCPVGPPP